MKRLLITLLMFIGVPVFAQDGNNYPLWATPKDSVDVWIDSARARLYRAIDSKMDTTKANEAIALMYEAIDEASWRQQYGDTNAYDLTKHQAAQVYYSKTEANSRFLQSFTESDPIYSASPSFGITNGLINNWNTAYGWGNHSGLYVSLSGSYSNPNWVTSLAWAKIAGAPTIPTNTNQLTNGAGFLTGITGSQVTTALGYTPYNGATNPNGYISTSSVTLRNKAGLVSNSVVLFSDTFSVSTSTPTIDLSSYISAAGKSNCRVVSVVAYRVGATTSNSPNVTVTGMSNTGATLIFNQTNTATVTILSINVLSGLPTILTPDPINVKVLLTAYFY